MIDLSSDTATKPSPEMRAVIRDAEVGDEQRLEDPSVNRLVEAVSKKLGKEAGLFLPSGTMCNLIAVKTHTQPGDTVFVGHNCHILRCETGAASAVSGVVLDQIESEAGCFTANQLAEALFTENNYTPVPRLVCVEQSHNFGGGAIWPLKDLTEIRELAHSQGLKVHMDGARLFNAAVGSGVPAKDYAATVDSVWVDFTKGLGAPLGAVLCGTKDFITQARRYKHMFGGALRQAGMMAAGCLYALENNIERLAEDHRRAQWLYDSLQNQSGLEIVRKPDTNIIFLRVTGMETADFMSKLEGQGVRFSSVGDLVRIVTHLHITDDDVTQTIETVTKILS